MKKLNTKDTGHRIRGTLQKEYATGQHMRFEVRDRLEKFTKSLYIDTMIKVIGYIS